MRWLILHNIQRLLEVETIKKILKTFRLLKHLALLPNGVNLLGGEGFFHGESCDFP